MLILKFTWHNHLGKMQVEVPIAIAIYGTTFAAKRRTPVRCFSPLFRALSGARRVFANQRHLRATCATWRHLATKHLDSWVVLRMYDLQIVRLQDFIAP